MKIAICDDEISFAQKLEELVKRYAEKQKRAVSLSVFTCADDFLNSALDAYNLVFLDVKLGSESGITLARKLREKNTSAVLIFISAFIEYAVMGYSVNASAYLLKSDLDGTFENCMREIEPKLTPKNEALTILVNNTVLEIPLSRIVYIESFKRQVTIHTNLEEHAAVEYYARLLDVERQLETQGFLRIQRSFLVNMRYCTKIKKRIAYLYNGVELPCSKQDYRAVVDAFLRWKGAE